MTVWRVLGSQTGGDGVVWSAPTAQSSLTWRWRMLCKDNNPIIVRRESIWMILESWRPSPVVTFNAFGRFLNLLPWQKLYLGACYWRCVIWLKSMQVQSVSPMTTMSKVYGKRISQRLLFPAVFKYLQMISPAVYCYAWKFRVWLLSKVYEVTICRRSPIFKYYIMAAIYVIENSNIF